MVVEQSDEQNLDHARISFDSFLLFWLNVKFRLRAVSIIEGGVLKRMMFRRYFPYLI